MDISSIFSTINKRANEVFDTLQRCGAVISRMLGEPDCGIPSHSAREQSKFRELFEIDALSSVLPYESYDVDKGIFTSANSLGFVIEAVPLVGLDHTAQKEISSIFEEILAEGASIQCLLLADHRISRFISHWSNSRVVGGDIIEELVRRRSEHYLTRKHKMSRMFRFMLSYSIPYGECFENDLSALEEKKNTLLKTLNNMTYAFVWEPRDFLETVGGMINFNQSPEVFSRKWNPLDSLSRQITTGGRISVREHDLVWRTEQPMHFKSFRATEYPDHWSVYAMNLLIGDCFRRAYQIVEPFYLHYGVHCPKQSKEEASFWRKSQLIENQGKSGMLLRVIPELKHELRECHQIRRTTKKGARFVWTQLSR